MLIQAAISVCWIRREMTLAVETALKTNNQSINQYAGNRYFEKLPLISSIQTKIF